MTTPAERYRLLLRLLPRGFRERNGPEMERLFLERLEDSAGPSRSVIWAGALWDVVKAAIRLRLRGPRRTWRSGDVRHRAVGLPVLDGAIQDLGFAVRSLRRRAGFTAVAVTVLAVGIGANAAIFSVVNGVLLRPLPYRASERIGVLWHDFGDGAQSLPVLNPLDLYDYREWSRVFETFTLGVGDERILGGPDEARIVDVGFVEAGFFEFFGVEPARGRTILREDDPPGADPVAVLSHRLWSRAFGADPGTVGRRVELDGRLHEIVGVLPPDFRLRLPPEAIFLKDAEIWTAARIDPEEQGARNFTLYTAFGRIRPGTTFADAQAELDRMAARLRELHPVHAVADLRARVVPLHHDLVKEARPGLVFLFGAVALVLVVACANVANLLLVRGRGRREELAIRAALGAGRRRVLRLVLMESLVLAGAGGALGVALAAGGIEAVRVLGRETLPLLDGVALDGRALLFVVAATALAALAAGIVPGLRAAARSPATALRAGRRASADRAGARIRDGLVLAEVAVSLVLLVGAGLMIRSFHALQDVDPGFSHERALTFRLSLPDASYPDDESESAFYRALDERLRGFPGVRGVSAISQLPLTGSGVLQPYAYDEETAAKWESVTADRRWIAPAFFRTMGATLIQGREFTPEDLESERDLVVVDDRLAERAFPDGDAVGRRLQIRPAHVPPEDRYAEVIGVVAHLRLHDLSRPHLTQLYSPMRDSDRFTVVVRVAGSDVGSLASLIRREVEALGPGIPLEDFRTMESVVSRALAPARVSLVLMVVFGGVALVLAAVGLYGVLAFTVRQRAHEIGVRIALGQGPVEVRRAVLRQGMRLVLSATALGALTASVLGRFASSLLYGVEPLDPVTYIAVTAVLAGTAVVACWLPARRATRIDPVEALRAE